MTFPTSILSPDALAVDDDAAAPGCFADLHLDQIIAAVAGGHPEDGLAKFFYTPLRDVFTVRYRHEVFRDLQRNEVRRPIENFITGIATMRQRLDQSARLWHPLQQQGWFSHAAEAYCSAVETLRVDLAPLSLTSRGLRDFAEFVSGYVTDQRFQTLSADTKAVQSQLRQIRYTVHIEGLRVHIERYADQTDYSAQIVATFERFVTDEAKDYHVRMQDFPDMNHVEEQILECVAKLYPKNFALLQAFCDRNADFVAPTIDRFNHEIGFYLSYLAFMDRFTAAGLSFSYPDVSTDPGVVHADGAFDLALAIKSVDDRKPVVCNDFQLSCPERVFVVTGPNQGGKTTFARTIGQCLYLAALGCPVPANRAALMLPDHIYTHFEREETLSTLHGKLDDELVRIHGILSQASAASVVVMNESFASTTADDALLIGTKVLERIIKLGCVAVYVTFLDEMADFDPRCVSMVGEVAEDDPTRRTFRFTRRPADGRAYAAALANKYGLNHDALLQRITA